jgi:hypothetical protein
MCNFFSCISNGEGKVLYFKIEDIAKIMAKGNPKEYEWNSHTSIAHFHKLTPTQEDQWNKWEYNVDSKILQADQINTKNDNDKVLVAIQKYFNKKDIVFIRNLYNRNSGNSNSGNRNSGDWNSGNRNSGNSNSGNSNSGNRNSGNRNSGDSNSGNSNSGDWNSGDRNSGNLNTGTPDKFRIFNKWITKDKYNNIVYPNFFRFELNQWITDDTATQEEKEKYKLQIANCGRFLKKLDYKEAWQLSYQKATQEDKDKVKKIPGFNKKLFLEITGINTGE